MRIIGGEFRGKNLNTFRGRDIRPTSDRLRESLFNIMGKRVHDTHVLDLFAGTGALGIEALSRGAQSAVFIDHYKPAIRLIQRNIRDCDLDRKAGILYWNIKNNLNCLQTYDPAFDLVFMDPPYDKNLVEQTLSHLCETPILARNANIIVEHSLDEHIRNVQPNFTLTDQRKYGKTRFTFLSYNKHTG